MVGAQNCKLIGLSQSDTGLIQAVADNFDANVSSQNSLQSTHALAIVLTQVKKFHEETSESETSNIK